MIERTITTITLWVAVIALLFFFKAPAGAALLILLAAATQYELYGLMARAGLRPFKSVGIGVGALFLVAAYFFPQWPATVVIHQNYGFDGAALALVIIALTALAPKIPDRVSTLAATAFGFIYVPYLLHYFIKILHLGYDPTGGLLLAFWVIVVVKFADIGAYLTGSLLGRNKLAPEISPGKTWEGMLGGLVLAALVGAGYVFYFGEHLPMTIPPLMAAFLAIPVAIVSVASDLLESVFKRQAGVKDSGNTIPGIGGAFDLTDSLILSAPVAYGIFLILV